MKIQSFEVIDLLGRGGKISSSMHGDLNILTGRNGAGKTSLLKLLWYVMSGNILQALHEVPFQSFSINTDEYQCTIHRISKTTCRVEMVKDGEATTHTDEFDHDGDAFINAEDEPNDIMRACGKSVFFPTFRRIEGGFGVSETRANNLGNIRNSKPKGDVEEALGAVSRKLSRGNHIFVSSISTVDIVTMLLQKYADLSQQNNDLQEKTSQEIIDQIKGTKRSGTEDQQLNIANKLLDEILETVEAMDKQRIETMAPIEAVGSTVSSLFKKTSVKIGTRINFGDAATAVSSDLLSAGEKQMLSFISYNALNENSVIFIDEPELSLHADWQRQLFGVLQRQQSSNQFIIATHSPFIYSKYPDKEVIIDSDRGDAD